MTRLVDRLEWVIDHRIGFLFEDTRLGSAVDRRGRPTHFYFVGAAWVDVTRLSYHKLTDIPHDGTPLPQGLEDVTYCRLARGTMAWLRDIAAELRVRYDAWSHVYMDWDRIGHWIFHRRGQAPRAGQRVHVYLVRVEIEGGRSYLDLWRAFR